MKKTLILMRGLPGSGKSTLAAEFAGEDGLVFSTDNYYIRDGVYTFDASRIKMAHEWNQQGVETAMKKEHPLIVVDNTNLSFWERNPYKALAELHSYEVQVVHPITDWAWDVDECTERNAHGVPRQTIAAMKDRAAKDKEFGIPKEEK